MDQRTTNGEQNMRSQRIQKTYAFIKFAVLLLILIGLPLYLYLFHWETISQWNDLEDFKAVLTDNLHLGLLVYFGIQITQVIISVIPGQIVQLAAGYVYGFWIGYLMALIGVALGELITFMLARRLGQDALRLMFGEKRFHRFLHAFNSKRAFIIVFIMYLIPGFPKDMLTYVAGASKMPLRSFMLISLVGRSPAMMGSIAIGRMADLDMHMGVILLSAVAILLCILGYIFREKVTGFVDELYGKLKNEEE